MSLSESEQKLEDLVQGLIEQKYLGKVNFTNEMKHAIWWKMEQLRKQRMELETQYNFLCEQFNSFAVRSKVIPYD